MLKKNQFFNLKELVTNPDWYEFFHTQSLQGYWQKIEKNLAQVKKFYPEPQKIFKIFNSLSPRKIKIVILGQDPYHQKNQADGFAFSSRLQKIPASLRNIYQELFKNKTPTHADLSSWVEQGVFLLNSILTVEESKPLSHQNFGWQEFSKNVLYYLNKEPKCFLLWGKNAIKYEKYLQNQQHLILKTTHPSPLSAYRGFLGCNHFQQANLWLKNNQQKPIFWKSVFDKTI